MYIVLGLLASLTLVTKILDAMSHDSIGFTMKYLLSARKKSNTYMNVA